MSDTPFTDIFNNHQIRISGTVNDPLFAMADVANLLGDQNYKKKAKKYGENHITRVKIMDANGHHQMMFMLTELGLYKFLMRSKSPRAEEFQEWAYNKIKGIRQKIVDGGELAIRIAKHAEKEKKEITDRAKELIAFAETETDIAKFCMKNNLDNQRNLRSCTFRRAIDTNYEELAEFYIARFFAENAISNPETMYYRDVLKEHTVDRIYNLAKDVYHSNDYDDFYDDVCNILTEDDEAICRS